MYLASPDYDEFAVGEAIVAKTGILPGSGTRVIDKMPHFQINLSTHLNDISEIGAGPLEGADHSRQLMITVNTWGGRFSGPHFKSPTQAIANGEFDRSFQVLFEKLKAFGSNLYLRLNPEMEVPAWVYPWQWDRNNYIESFRHVSRLLELYAPEAKLVWGPAGYPGSMEFYPGDDFVDACSVTLKSASEMDLNVYPKDYPAKYDLFRRIHRLRFAGKPVFVLTSEFSAAISLAEFKWLDSILENNKEVAYHPDNLIRPRTNRITRDKKQVRIGVYDPEELLVSHPQVIIEHLFADFGNLADGRFQERFVKALERNHDLIITFEPFRHPSKGRDNQVLQNITNGKYDAELTALFDILNSTSSTIYLRYAHEMEIPITRYPWQSQDPLTYIKSFRYFMNFNEPSSPHIKRVWGPAGDRGSTEWWPGSDVVDYVSFAVYGLPDKNITDAKKQESFETIYNRKATRFWFIDKPIFITEFGVKGPEDFQRNWLLNAAGVIREHPQIIGVNYFNMVDTPKAWGDIEPPNWSISSDTFDRFIEALRDSVP